MVNRTKTELDSQYYEEFVRQIMRKFNGQQIGGTIFGQEFDIKLPKFDSVTRVVISGGLGEYDAVGKIEEDALWIAEVKWRKRRAGISEIMRLISRDKSREFGVKKITFWLISRSGFTVEAQAYAKANRIMFSDEECVNKLINLLSIIS